MLFTSNLVPTITDSNDMKVSSMLIDLWTSFAVDGYFFIYGIKLINKILILFRLLVKGCQKVNIFQMVGFQWKMARLAISTLNQNGRE